MKILVTGSRTWRDTDLLHDVLRLFGNNVTLVHGGAAGADNIAAWHAHYYAEGWKVLKYPANWKQYGRRAGSIRNQQMLDMNPDIDLVLAFPMAESIGTWDMIRRVRKAHIPHIIIHG